MSSNSEWKKKKKKKKLIYLLENCHTGDFLTGTHTDVAKKSAENMKSDNYYDPTETMPEPPPPKCIDTHDTDENPRSLSCPCDSCQNLVELFLAESPAKIAILGTIYSGRIEPFRNWDWNGIWWNAKKKIK